MVIRTIVRIALARKTPSLISQVVTLWTGQVYSRKRQEKPRMPLKSKRKKLSSQDLASLQVRKSKWASRNLQRRSSVAVIKSSENFNISTKDQKVANFATFQQNITSISTILSLKIKKYFQTF